MALCSIFVILRLCSSPDKHGDVDTIVHVILNLFLSWNIIESLIGELNKLVSEYMFSIFVRIVDKLNLGRFLFKRKIVRATVKSQSLAIGPSAFGSESN